MIDYDLLCTWLQGACVIQGLEEVVVSCKEQVYQMLRQGAAKRQTASTLLNAHSRYSYLGLLINGRFDDNLFFQLCSQLSLAFLRSCSRNFHVCFVFVSAAVRFLLLY